MQRCDQKKKKKQKESSALKYDYKHVSKRYESYMM